MTTAQFTLVNGQKMAYEKVKVYKHGKMAQNMKAIGRMISRVDMEGSYMVMETAIMEIC